MTTYLLCKKFIMAKVYSQEDIQKRVDVFYMAKRFTEEQYLELTKLVSDTYATPTVDAQ